MKQNRLDCKEIVKLADSIIEEQDNMKLYKKIFYNRIFSDYNFKEGIKKLHNKKF